MPKKTALGTLTQFYSWEDGATAVEYGLIIALVVIAMIVGLNDFATEFTALYEKILNTVQPVLES